MLVSVKIADGQILHAVEHTAAQLAEKALRNYRHELVVRGYREHCEQIQHDKDYHYRDYLRKCRAYIAVAALEIVGNDAEHLLHEYRRDGRYYRGKYNAHRRQRNKTGIKLYQQTENTAERAGLFAALNILLIILHLRHLLSAARKARGRYPSCQAAAHACPMQLFCRRRAL